MGTSQYARLDALIDGVTLVELQDVTLTLDGGLIEVRTIQKGFAGHTEGGGKASIKFGSAIPKGGQEFDFLSAVANHSTHSVEIPVGGKSYQSTGRFLNAEVSQSDKDASKVSAEWEGDLLALQ